MDLLKNGSISSFIAKNPQIDTIIHAAGLVGGVKGNTDRMFDFFNENLMMAANVMNEVACNPKIVNATFMLSTCIFPQFVLYPVGVESLHSGEPHPTNYGYAYAKRMLEVGARALRQQYGKNVRCIVPCNLYGPNDNYDIDGGHVIPSLIHKCYLAKRDNTPFVVWGSGMARREFIYSEDINKVLRAIHLDSCQSVDMMIVSSDEEYSIRNIVACICKHMGFTGEVIYDTSMPEGIMRKPTDSSSFRRFREKAAIALTSLDEGIAKTINNFLENYPNVRM